MNANNIEGICAKCGEHTTVAEYCCNGLVYSEGHTYDADDYCPDCGSDEYDRLEGECPECYGSGKQKA